LAAPPARASFASAAWLATVALVSCSRLTWPRTLAGVVGKSSILLRFTDNTFNDQQPSTIGVDFKVKMVELNGTKIKATIWDTAVSAYRVAEGRCQAEPASDHLCCFFASPPASSHARRARSGSAR
jgi:hypothetical protein